MTSSKSPNPALKPGRQDRSRPYNHHRRVAPRRPAHVPFSHLERATHSPNPPSPPPIRKAPAGARPLPARAARPVLRGAVRSNVASGRARPNRVTS
ncbi:hypothetical protein NL676_002036 [Syzygium grande]|nr:hypothetical protein NL676_002036 [Syzygium grande]